MTPGNWPKTWATKTWAADGCTLTEADLLALWNALRAGGTKAERHQRAARALGVPLLSERKADRALQLLRKAGMIAHGKDGWTIVTAWMDAECPEDMAPDVRSPAMAARRTGEAG